jgi:hypothetical protein
VWRPLQLNGSQPLAPAQKRQTSPQRDSTCPGYGHSMPAHIRRFSSNCSFPMIAHAAPEPSDAPSYIVMLNEVKRDLSTKNDVKK